MYFLLLFGIFCCSTSVIFIKIGTTDPVLLAAYRCILGGLILSPIAWKRLKRHAEWNFRRLLAVTWPPMFFLAIHFVSWIFGARLTPAANASLLVNMVPVVMPLLLFLYLREMLNRAEIAGTVLAMTGVFLLGAGDFNLSPEYALGDAISFLSMLFYAIYLIYARKHREIPSIYLYVVPVYLGAGLICLVLGLLRYAVSADINLIGGSGMKEWISILGLALVPTVLGHSIINHAMKNIRGQVVAILNLGQFIFAGTMGYFLLGEVPSIVFLTASLLVILGALLVTRILRPAVLQT